MTDLQDPETTETGFSTEAPRPPAPQKKIIPFEDRSLPFFTGLWRTIQQVLFDPVRFFREHRMDGGGSIGRPMLFALITGWIGIIFDTLWNRLLSDVVFNWVKERLEDSNLLDLDWDKYDFGSIGSPLGQGAEDMLSITVGPVLMMLGLFIMAGVFHLFLMMVKGNRQTFETTFSVVSYGIASHLALVLPFCGFVISWGYGLILNIIGLKEAHPTTSGKASFAVLGPLALCCVCCAAAAMMLGLTGGLAGLAR